jgi:hypothetical protein
MHTNTTRLVLVATTLVAGLGIAGAAVAQGGENPAQSTTVADPARQTVPAQPPTQNTPTVEQERGIVLEGSGEADGLAASTTVYENDRYGNSVQVVLGDPDDDRIGYAEQAQPFVVDGHLTATVEIDGRPAVLSGTVVASGRPERLVDPGQDAGEQRVVRGTHTALVTDVTLSYDGTTVPLQFAPAFAYDLEVRTVDLYGN